MHDQAFVRNFLRINGYGPDTAESDLRTALLEARWNQKEIDMALSMAKEGVPEAPVEAAPAPSVASKPAAAEEAPAHTFSYSRLSSDKLSTLLGIDVIVDPRFVRDARTTELVRKKNIYREFSMWLVILAVSGALTFGCGWFMMYTMEIGPYKVAEPWF